MDASLRDMPRKLHLLNLQLVPGQADRTERVSVTRAVAPTPARLDVLSLVGPGAGLPGLPRTDIINLHPLVRHWRSERIVTVTVLVGGEPRSHEQTIVQWNHELVRDAYGKPLQVLPEDQIGVLPPAEWLDMWVRGWRKALGHSVPSRTRPVAPGGAGDQPRVGYAATAASIASKATQRGRPDPVREDYEARFGQPARGYGPTEDIAYLRVHLDAACQRDIGVGEFAGELRALSAELTRVLGEETDLVWLGRCPATLTDREDGSARPCGAGLWHNPYTGEYVGGQQTGPGQIMCPRCHTTWGPKQVEVLHLAGEIRRVWPLDRRRRYTLAEVGQVPRLDCPGCGWPVVVHWREVTPAGDRERWWRAERVSCDRGCEDAGRLM